MLNEGGEDGVFEEANEVVEIECTSGGGALSLFLISLLLERVSFAC